MSHLKPEYPPKFPQNPEFRLFIPSNSDDLSHDEALSSRIAALNLLDLSLENLGVEIDPSVIDEMMDIMKACGDSTSLRGLFAEWNSSPPSPDPA